ncbi:signal recognition particle subunit [Schizosaccharomyces cryophilus OY26]|uniref:Signal recognition particle subunit SRP68 n=1 Tax=Schizosaccharomyces cryophilus (strain OY26 / ATCC MYA-4695 / CBS 11777 / NBRC 106824 / NRRL Y48691) TaxID=653667 RepID=S9VUY7_SCHCR|nr:signal recognition particle subunit [Schizosaccharomyces cryophilus OY26]EPY49994.1 signal recognition particle subunit [Schizosaccharomyces cryophilus OY26]
MEKAGFYLLPLLLEARSDHFYEGNEYMKYLSQRIHSLRKALNITQKGGKPKTSADKRFAEIQLFDADRAFQQYTYLRSSQRQHALRRLKRALQTSKELVSFCESKDHNNHIFILEAAAFMKYIEGTFLYEKRSWEDSLRSFSSSRLAFQQLQRSLEALSEHQRGVFNELLAQIDSTIRYVAQRSGLENQTQSLDILMLANVSKEDLIVQHIQVLNPQVLESNAEDQAGTSSITRITWRDQTIQITHPEIVLALYGIHDVQAGMDVSTTVDDRLLGAWANAEKTTKSVLDSISPESNEYQELSICYSYLAYNLIVLRIQRDIHTQELPAVKNSLANLRAQQSLYDTIIKNIEAAKSLPGIAKDNGMMVQLEAQIAIVKARRCQVIADAYQSQDKAKGLAMCIRAGQYYEQANDYLHNFEENPLEIAFDIVMELQTGPNDLKKRILLLRSLASLEMINQKPKDLSLVESMDQYVTTESEKPLNLTQLKLRPIPAKPLFFDLAITYLGQQTEFGKAKPQKEETEELPSESKTKGFFRSLLGRK